MRRTAQVVCGLGLAALAVFLVADAAADAPAFSPGEFSKSHPTAAYALGAGAIGFLAGAVYWPREAAVGWAYGLLVALPVFALCAFVTHAVDGTPAGVLASTLGTLTGLGHACPAVVLAPAVALGRLVWAPKRSSR